ncbi:MAG: DUF3500 domain-containing protein [Cyanobacteria bacterium J06627_28]
MRTQSSPFSLLTVLSLSTISVTFFGSVQPIRAHLLQADETVHTHSAVHQALVDDSQPLTQSLQDVRYQELSEAVQSFINILDDEQRATVLLPFDDPNRTRDFCYVLARCKEDYILRIADLNSAQKIALNNVLMKGFSGAGYSRAIQTINNEWLIEEMENAHRADPERYPTVGSPLVADWPPPPNRNAADFYIAFFGDPASMAPWALRFEGHHLSLNLTFNGEGEPAAVGAFPMFFGSSPMIVPESPDVLEGEVNPYPRWQSQEGQQMLHREAWLGRSFLQALETPVLESGAWAVLPDVVMAGGAEVPLDADSFLEGKNDGIAVAELSELQQSLLWEFVLEFLQVQANHSVDLESVRADIAEGRVWWFGDIEDEQADFYLRVQSDRYLVELLQSNTFAVLSEVDSNHVHASFRDLTNDWDYNALGAHVHEHHPELAHEHHLDRVAE